jgi:hypothetical protein
MGSRQFVEDYSGSSDDEEDSADDIEDGSVLAKRMAAARKAPAKGVSLPQARPKRLRVEFLKVAQSRASLPRWRELSFAPLAGSSTAADCKVILFR